MSLIPIREQPGSIFSYLDTWDPLKDLEIWNPFTDFPFPPNAFLPQFPREIFPSVQTHVKWTQNRNALVFKAYLPGLTCEDVIVFVDDDNVLQISTDDNKFMSRFKLPDDARADQVTASMENGFLVVRVAKEAAANARNIRVVEITD